ncbi:MAG: EamA family transporter [Planctomycetota bacterium]
MEPWKWYAVASAVFAGLTAVLAKAGLKGLGADTALFVRTWMVAGMVLVLALWVQGGKATWAALSGVGGKPFAWLAASALATTASWVCYYRAMEGGDVHYVALVDKGSILITLVGAALLLGERISLQTAGGAGLILAGLIVIARG